VLQQIRPNSKWLLILLPMTASIVSAVVIGWLPLQSQVWVSDRVYEGIFYAIPVGGLLLIGLGIIFVKRRFSRVLGWSGIAIGASVLITFSLYVSILMSIY
jgi:hypothetical protein